MASDALDKRVPKSRNPSPHNVIPNGRHLWEVPSHASLERPIQIDEVERSTRHSGVECEGADALLIPQGIQMHLVAVYSEREKRGDLDCEMLVEGRTEGVDDGAEMRARERSLFTF